MSTIRVQSEEIVASAGTQYSAAAELMSVTAARNGQVNIAWYNAAHGFISRSSGSATSISTTWVPKNILSQTAPGGTAFLRMEVEFNGNVGDDYYVDKAVVAVGSNPVWSAGGFAGDAEYVIERSADGGLTWEEVPGATRDEPAQINEDPSVQSDIEDRLVPLRVPVKYRGYAKAGTVFSPDAETAEETNLATDWWLRLYDDDTYDTPVKVLSHDGSYGPGATGATFYPEGRRDPIVVHGKQPASDKFSLEIRTLDKATYDKVMTILKSKERIVLQSVLGRVWVLKVTGDISWRMGRASPRLVESFPIRHFHEIRCEVTEVG